MKSFFIPHSLLKYLSGICLTCLCLGLHAQPVITENIITDRFNNVYKEVLYETNLNIDAQLTGILSATGPNQTWDFTNLNYIDSTVVFEEILNIPDGDPLLNDPNFANSNFIRKATFPPVDGGLPDTTIQIRYCTLENGEWTVNGALSIADLDMDGTVDTFLQWFSPPSLIIPFPVTASSQWFDSTSINQIFTGQTFTSSIIIDSNWVEGHGTLITPAGTVEALRIRNKKITSVPGSPISDISNDIDFVTADNSLGASIVVEDGRAFYSKSSSAGMTTSVHELPDFSFHLAQNYPNPFKDQTTVSFRMQKADEVEIKILDLKGGVLELVANEFFAVGEHELYWSSKNRAAGTYILQVRVGNQVQHRKMVLER